MESYTERMEDSLYHISDDVDDYEAATRAFLLREESNRTFGQALIAFASEHCGFIGGMNPTSLIIESCKKHGVDCCDIAKDQRTYTSWFSGSRRIEKRETMFALAFGLGLDVEQTKSLFHKVYLDRAFDFRNEREIVYYYCLKNKKPWSVAKKLILSIPTYSAGVNDDRTIATQYIKSGIESINSDADLICYISRHAHNLALKNVTAKKHLARQTEAARKFALEEATEREHGGERELWDRYKYYDPNSNSFLYYVITDQSAVGGKGTETVFTKDVKAKYSSGVFRCFPEVKTLSAKDLSSEEMRKALVLLFSYVFWSTAKEKKMTACKLYDDFRLQLDDLLVECGMPPLYPGNPYDWLFLFCTLEDDPLNSFRTIIGDILEPLDD